MAEITASRVAAPKTQLAFGDAAADDTCRCGAGTTLLVDNGTAGAITLTITVPGNNTYAQANPDPVISCPAGQVTAVPMLDAYKDPTDGLAHLTWSATPGATLTRALLIRR